MLRDASTTLILVASLLFGMALLGMLAGVRAWRRSRKVTSEAPAPGMGSRAMPNPRDLDMARPWRQRLLKPMLRRLYGLGRRF